jgi:hypothetical protein
VHLVLELDLGTTKRIVNDDGKKAWNAGIRQYWTGEYGNWRGERRKPGVGAVLEALENCGMAAEEVSYGYWWQSHCVTFVMDSSLHGLYNLHSYVINSSRPFSSL